MGFAIILSLIAFFFRYPTETKTHTKKKQRVESSTSESSTVKFVGEIVRGWNSENLKLGARGREAELDQQLQKMVAETQSNTVFFLGSVLGGGFGC